MKNDASSWRGEKAGKIVTSVCYLLRWGTLDGETKRELSGVLVDALKLLCEAIDDWYDEDTRLREESRANVEDFLWAHPDQCEETLKRLWAADYCGDFWQREVGETPSC